MKPMLDKDFDAVFKSSFEDYEVAPAADSWTKISEQINPKVKKKAFPVFWMAAASIIIVLGIGVGLYTQPTDVIKLHPDTEGKMLADLVQEQDKLVSATKVDKPAIQSFNKPALKIKTSASVNETIAKVENVATEESQNSEPLTTELTSVKNVKSVRPKLVTEQLIAQEEISDLKKASATTLNDNNNSFNKNTVIASATPRKIKISSVGDFVNFVVAKVDKREDKIIKLSKTEESDNEITGINLGLIKFSKQD